MFFFLLTHLSIDTNIIVCLEHYNKTKLLKIREETKF